MSDCNILQSFSYLSLVTLFMMLCLCSSAAQADFSPQFGLGQSTRHESSAHDGFSAQSSEPAGPKKINISSTAFAKYRRYFSQMCEGMGYDGRSIALFNILDLNAVPDETCLACRPLLRAMANACKPRAEVKKKVSGKKSKEAEEQAAAALEPTPTPVPKQREPNTMVVDAALRGFGAITEEFKYPEELLKAVNRLDFLLTAREGKSVGEREYFGTLASFIKLPVERMIKERGLGQSAKPQKSQEELNALFEF